MQLSFYARSDVLVPMPGQAPRPRGDGVEMASGPPAQYVAREWVAPKGLRRTRAGLQCDEPAKYICSSTPFRCESNSPMGERMIRHMTRKRCRPTASRPNGDYPLWCADQQTAEFLGIPFVPVDVLGGETVPRRATTTASKAPSRAGKGAD